jgi:UPF0042 nucleotide-binding protein
MKPASLAVITGLSGSGKSVASKALEDLGYFCIDNLPLDLLDKLLQLGYLGEPSDIGKLALVMDLRDPNFAARAVTLLPALRDFAHRVDVVFLEADDVTIQRRFSETRRRHPAAADLPLENAIAWERQRLADIRAIADWVVDTSSYTPHDLRRRIQARFAESAMASALAIRLVSFGFKFGPPSDADLVMDVRFLPNPYFVEGLRELTGKDEAVARYVLQQDVTKEFLAKFTDLLFFLAPNYQREGKTYLTIAIGCTGGRHRSVAIAEAVAELLQARDIAAAVRHRDCK